MQSCMQAQQVLRDFAARAEEQVLAALVEGWAAVDPDVIMNPSQLASEQTLAWNLMKPGAPCCFMILNALRLACPNLACFCCLITLSTLVWARAVLPRP